MLVERGEFVIGSNERRVITRLISNVYMDMPVAASYILTVFSYEPDSIHWPSAEKATEVTSSLWPLSGIVVMMIILRFKVC